MNQYKKLLFATLSILLLGICISCEKSKEIDNKQTWEERWVIGSERVLGSEGILYYWIKRNDSTEWEREYGLKGFTYEEGYEYVVDVKATVNPDPPQDAPAWDYSLIRIISKEKKDSDVPQLD